MPLKSYTNQLFSPSHQCHDVNITNLKTTVRDLTSETVISLIRLTEMDPQITFTPLLDYYNCWMLLPQSPQRGQCRWEWSKWRSQTKGISTNGRWPGNWGIWLKWMQKMPARSGKDHFFSSSSHCLNVISHNFVFLSSSSTPYGHSYLSSFPLMLCPPANLFDIDIWHLCCSCHSGEPRVWPPFWEGVSMGGQQHSWEEFLHLLHLEAEPALPAEEGGVCECQFPAAGRYDSSLTMGKDQKHVCFSSDPRCSLYLASMIHFFLACSQSPDLNLKCFQINLCNLWVDLWCGFLWLNTSLFSLFSLKLSLARAS